MTPTAWIAIAGIGITFLLNAAAYLVGYGILKATVGALAERVIALERQNEVITELRISAARMTAAVEGLTSHMDNLGGIFKTYMETEAQRAKAARRRPPQ